MKLSGRTLTALAEMICGGSGGSGGFSWDNFPYRSSSYLTEFFRNCDLQFVHDGTTRKWWVLQVLEELNQAPATKATLPSDPIVRVIQELMDPLEFQGDGLDREAALEDLNVLLSRDGVQAYFDGAGRCHVRAIASQDSTAGIQPLRRALTPEEISRRKELEKVVANCDEDEFTEDLLVPLLRQLGFVRIAVSGHRDRSLEYGKDLWMKYQLPTDHFLYFGVQVKRGRIDSRAGSMTQNIATVLDQIRMSLGHPIWDPETNRKNLLDHVIIVASGEITKAAKNLMAQHLDTEMRRQVLFLDRDDLLDLWLRVQLPVPGSEEEQEVDDDLPF